MHTQCNCKDYPDLEFKRSDISKRIKVTPTLKKSLSLVAKLPDNTDLHKLYICESCGQQWQLSRAWNWVNEPYLFRVPSVSAEEWLTLPYVQPDEMLIFIAVLEGMTPLLRQLQELQCRMEPCRNKAIVGSVFCPQHHIESLQAVPSFPAYPRGRWFPPYERNGVIPW